MTALFCWCNTPFTGKRIHFKTLQLKELVWKKKGENSQSQFQGRGEVQLYCLDQLAWIRFVNWINWFRSGTRELKKKKMTIKDNWIIAMQLLERFIFLCKRRSQTSQRMNVRSFDPDTRRIYVNTEGQTGIHIDVRFWILSKTTSSKSDRSINIKKANKNKENYQDGPTGRREGVLYICVCRYWMSFLERGDFIKMTPGWLTMTHTPPLFWHF